MYRTTEILESWGSLIGWKQDPRPDKKINVDLTDSESAQYYQAFHPMLTLDNCRSVALKTEGVVYPEWDSGVLYGSGEIVLYSTVQYIAKGASQGVPPGANDTLWGLYDSFSEWISEKTRDAQIKVLRELEITKLANRTQKNIIENKTLFDQAGSIRKLTENEGFVVGFNITSLRADGVTTEISRLCTSFKNTGAVRLYLFHSSKPNYLRVIELTHSVDGGSQWHTLAEKISLPYYSEQTGPGGTWFLCYRQNEIEAEGLQAIKSDFNFDLGPCTCNRSEYRDFSTRTQYTEITPFRITDESTEVTGDYSNDYNDDFNSIPASSGGFTLWGIEQATYIIDNNYGLNFQYNMICDVTDILIEQKFNFVKLIGLQVAIDLLLEFVYNPAFNITRQNQNSQGLRLLYELDGDSQSPKKSGLRYELAKAYKAVSVDLDKLSRACYTKARRGVRVGAA